jgi:outer membrane biosynthesis protein TonB
LNQAAIDAIKKYGKFPPAIQNKQPVGTWTTIPLVFRLQ